MFSRQIQRTTQHLFVIEISDHTPSICNSAWFAATALQEWNKENNEKNQPKRASMKLKNAVSDADEFKKTGKIPEHEKAKREKKEKKEKADEYVNAITHIYRVADLLLHARTFPSYCRLLLSLLKSSNIPHVLFINDHLADVHPLLGLKVRRRTTRRESDQTRLRSLRRRRRRRTSPPRSVCYVVHFLCLRSECIGLELCIRALFRVTG
jgi:hypothetical protein